MNSIEILAFFGMPAMLIITCAAVYFITGRLDEGDRDRRRTHSHG
jgi:hypothetical protein